MGHLVKTDTVCTEAVESDELLGYADTETRFVIAYPCEICSRWDPRVIKTFTDILYCFSHWPHSWKNTARFPFTRPYCVKLFLITKCLTFVCLHNRNTVQGKPLEEVNVFKHAVRIHIFFSFSREWRDGVLTVLLRRQAKELRLQETANTKTSGKPLMKWLHLDGTVISSF